MPKKTRKDKEAAMNRKRMRLLQELSVQAAPSIKQRIEEKPVLQSVNHDLLEDELGLKQYFIHDLRKSLILICFMIALEIVIYFASINNYLKF